MYIQNNFWESVIMEKDFLREWQKGREEGGERERDGGMSKWLMRLIASTEREALSKFERSKILDKLTGGKRKLMTVNLQEILLP